MKIKHRPLLDTAKVIKHYSEKDGVPIKYVCTTALGGGKLARDIFYRETPHPEFGNHYFGIGYGGSIVDSGIYICDADKIEQLTFNMIYVNDQWHYSMHRHDYNQVGDVAIDGGRAYCRIVGNNPPEVKTFVVRNGQFERTV